MSNPLFNMMNNQGVPNTPSIPNDISQQPGFIQAYQQVQQMMQSGQNPDVLLNQLKSRMSPTQVSQLDAYAKMFGMK